ncbi:hypothetical protein AB0952_22100 [Streptomyces caniferus]|uniref:hypothetical protein n=1 Tax=Streptomyces caniferus TaxID=285557 RepID=UPI0034565188
MVAVGNNGAQALVLADEPAASCFLRRRRPGGQPDTAADGLLRRSQGMRAANWACGTSPATAARRGAETELRRRMGSEDAVTRPRVQDDDDHRLAVQGASSRTGRREAPSWTADLDDRPSTRSLSTWMSHLLWLNSHCIQSG